MALQKTIQYNGINLAYHKIIETNINYANSISHVTLGSYVDKASRLAGDQPFQSFSFDWSGTDFPFNPNTLTTNVVVAAYDKIKADTNWTDSIDV